MEQRAIKFALEQVTQLVAINHIILYADTLAEVLKLKQVTKALRVTEEIHALTKEEEKP